MGHCQERTASRLAFQFLFWHVWLRQLRLPQAFGRIGPFGQHGQRWLCSPLLLCSIGSHGQSLKDDFGGLLQRLCSQLLPPWFSLRRYTSMENAFSAFSAKLSLLGGDLTVRSEPKVDPSD